MALLLAGAPQPAAAEKAQMTVLLDPGHGGTNTGAPSVRSEIFEKHVTLALAGRLEKELKGQGIRVLLSRKKDTYLTLRQRGRMANELDVDLFVSLHANATESHTQRGYETFILSPKAVDVDSRALRLDSGRKRPSVSDEVALLLDDVERSTSIERARQVAESVQDELSKLRGKEGNRGVRQDSMHVLLGATMPAILVEIGFIDHPIEGETLLQPSHIKATAKALAEAISAHREALAARR